MDGLAFLLLGADPYLSLARLPQADLSVRCL